MDQHIHFRIREKITEAPGAATLVLEPLEEPLVYQAGQFLTLLFDHLGPFPLRRSYSLSSAPEVDPWPAITVQMVPNGHVARYLVEEAQPGDVLTSLAPAGRFTVEGPASTPRDVVLIGGGSGITPLFSILKHLLYHDPLTRVVLLDANRQEDNILFRQDLRRLAAGFPDRFQGIIFLSDPQKSLPVLREQWAPLNLFRGRLGNALMEELVQQHLRHDPARAEFFLCGPSGLLLKAENTLGFLGFPPERIHREVFTVKTAYRPPADQFADSRIILRVNGERYEFPVWAGQTILEAAEAAGIVLPYSCRSGVCTTCSARCRSGRVEMYTQEGRLDSDLTRGLVLTCVGFPLSEVVELEMR